jgi:2,3-bisphosphoglycerate-independent phosphoglycerate mutase
MRLRDISLSGVEVFVEPVKEHRFVVVFRGNDLGGNVKDTDPQTTGVPLLEPVPISPESARTAELAADFARQGAMLLADQEAANAFSMRGFSAKPQLPSYQEVYGLRAAAIAVYPMYKGLAKLVGMDIVGEAKSLEEQIQVIRDCWDDYDFFFVHFKYTDSTGEDGDFDAKVQRIEEFDAAIPSVMELKPTVTVVTGDHSTPSFLKAHSWHAVPTLIVADACRTDACKKFGETESLRGGLGQFEAKYLMLLALANADRLNKYGA